MNAYSSIEIKGSQFHYRMEGDGPTVVLIHAGIADLRMWDGQFAALTPDHRVLAYDLRGFGRSDAPKADFARHEDLRDLLDALAIEQAALVGTSMGGQTAIDLAIAYPERVTRLVPVCCLPHGYAFKGDPPPIWQQITEAWEAGDMQKTNELETEMWIVGRGRHAEDVDAGVIGLVREMNALVLEREAEHEGKHQPLGPPAVARMHEIAVPTLVLSGQYDDPELTADWADLLPQMQHARQEVLPTAHLPNLEVPERFNALLREFLAS